MANTWRGKGKRRNRKGLKKRPTIDLHECRDCEACLELCPHVFRRNKETGRIEVADLSEYSEEELQEVMSMCPEDCIAWEEVG
jgi:ferredoxin